MRARYVLAAAALVVSVPVATITLAVRVAAQAPAQPAPAGGRGGRGAVAPPATAQTGRAATFPAQQRPPGDPEVIARGKTLFGINCAGCHGPDARGGDAGGPNLLRSQLVLDDQNGEKIGEVMRTGKQDGDKVMPPLALSADDTVAVATFIHSLAAAGRGRNAVPLNILVGNATAGQAYFASKCSTCHSATGDLKGIGSRVTDPLTLQNFWVSGGSGAPPGPNAKSSVVTATVTPAGGSKVEGTLVRYDDFLITLTDATGASRSFARTSPTTPKLEIHDPLQGHRDLFSVYTDKDIHDVTAYLVTLK